MKCDLKWSDIRCVPLHCIWTGNQIESAVMDFVWFRSELEQKISLEVLRGTCAIAGDALNVRRVIVTVKVSAVTISYI